jgi:hypothetical protein
MQEIFPIVAGMLIGLVAIRINNESLRASFLIALSLIVGGLATYLSGEWLISWAFIGVDSLLVILGVALVGAPIFGWSLWRSHQAQG